MTIRAVLIIFLLFTIYKSTGLKSNCFVTQDTTLEYLFSFKLSSLLIRLTTVFIYSIIYFSVPCVHIIIGTINVDIMQTESITYVVNVKSSDTYDSKNNDYIHDRIFCLQLMFSIGRAHSRLLNIFNMFL